MSLSDDLIAIRLRLYGAREVESGTKKAAAGVSSLGKGTTAYGRTSAYAEKKTSRLSRAYHAMGTAAKYAIGFLGVTGIFALRSAVEKTEELAKATAGLSRNLGLSANVASRWGAVAQARDIDTKTLTMSFTALSRRVTDAAREGGSAMTPFRMLGLTQADVARGSKDFQWILMRVAEALGEAGGGAKRQAAAQQLLGRGYQTVLPLFSEGTKSLKEQLRWADKYGVTLDGTTNDALMEMVNAQRESKVAMLGLQVALTKALLPAIEGGEEQLQKFIATLNDPKLTTDEKIKRIEQQFLALEDMLVKALADIIPQVAEQGGKLGLNLAGALWDGFRHSNAFGKMVIGWWVFTTLMGRGRMRDLLIGAGGRMGGWLGMAVLKAVAPYFAAEVGAEGLGAALAARFAKLRPLMTRWGGRLGLALALGMITFGLADPKMRAAFAEAGKFIGEQFVNGMIWMINKGIEAINDALDKANVFGKLGVDAPEIGKIDPVNWTNLTWGDVGQGLNGGGGNHTPPHPGAQSHPQGHIGADGQWHPNKRPIPRSLPSGRGSEIVLHNVIELDGKVVAESTARHAAAAAAAA